MENLILYEIFECATVIFETFIVYQYMSGLFEKRNGQKNAIMWYVLFCIGLMSLSLFLLTGIILTIYTLVSLYVLSMRVYKTSILSRVFAVFFFAALMMAAEIFTTGLVADIWKITLPNMFEYGLPRVLCILVTKLIQVLLVKCSVSIAHWKTNNTAKGESKMMLPLLLCQAFSIILAHYVFIICGEVFNGFSIIALCAMVGIIYINIIIFWYFDRVKAAYEYKCRSEAAELKIALERQYFQILNEHQIETDALWHDMKKHISLMKTLIAEGEHDISSNYIHELETEMDNSIKIIRTNYPVLSALLTEQKRRAMKAEVPYEIEIRLESELKMEPVDLCVILGNLFDNALEACTLLPSEVSRNISAFIGQRNNAISIRFINTYAPQSRSKWHHGKHGLGLKNVQQAIKKYNGKISFVEDTTIFKVFIVVP